jgi:hypothetical protein
MPDPSPDPGPGLDSLDNKIGIIFASSHLKVVQFINLLHANFLTKA